MQDTDCPLALRALNEFSGTLSLEGIPRPTVSPSLGVERRQAREKRRPGHASSRIPKDLSGVLKARRPLRVRVPPAPSESAPKVGGLEVPGLPQDSVLPLQFSLGLCVSRHLAV